MPPPSRNEINAVNNPVFWNCDKNNIQSTGLYTYVVMERLLQQRQQQIHRWNTYNREEKKRKKKEKDRVSGVQGEWSEKSTKLTNILKIINKQ